MNTVTTVPNVRTMFIPYLASKSENVVRSPFISMKESRQMQAQTEGAMQRVAGGGRRTRKLNAAIEQ